MTRQMPARAGWEFVKRRREPAGRFGGPCVPATLQARLRDRRPTQTRIRYAIRAFSFCGKTGEKPHWAFQISVHEWLTFVEIPAPGGSLHCLSFRPCTRFADEPKDPVSSGHKSIPVNPANLVNPVKNPFPAAHFFLVPAGRDSPTTLKL